MLSDIAIALAAVAIAVVVLACIHGPDWLARRWRRCDDEALQREIKRWRSQ